MDLEHGNRVSRINQNTVRSIKELFVINMTTDQPLGFMLKIFPIRGDKINDKC